MLDTEVIISALESIHEHTMAKDIFVPTLKAMGLKGVKYTGGRDEIGIDIEYYFLTEPEKLKIYVGIQFKIGDLVYKGGGGKNSVKEVRNQAEEAFEKEIYDTDTHAMFFISRFIAAATGDINETARKFIGRTRLKGNDRSISYWTGSTLAEYIQTHWMTEFEDYFSDFLESSEIESIEETPIIDDNFILQNYGELIEKCYKVLAVVSSTEKEILLNMAVLGARCEVEMGDLLIELGNSEEFYEEPFRHLASLRYIYSEDDLYLAGHAEPLQLLFSGIEDELIDAEEDPVTAKIIFNSLLY